MGAWCGRRAGGGGQADDGAPGGEAPVAGLAVGEGRQAMAARPAGGDDACGGVSVEFLDRLDPGLAVVLAKFPSGGTPNRDDVPGTRDFFEWRFAALAAALPVPPGLVWMHGGGLVLGSRAAADGHGG